MYYPSMHLVDVPAAAAAAAMQHADHIKSIQALNPYSSQTQFNSTGYGQPQLQQQQVGLAFYTSVIS